MYDSDALEGNCHDPRIEPFTSADVHLAPINRSDHLPRAGVISEGHKIILQDVFLVQGLRSKRCRGPLSTSR
jgi:hypothetical protein